MGTLYEVNGTTGNITSVRNTASTQWNTPSGGGTLVSLGVGETANYLSLIDNAVNKSAAGSTSYYEFNILDDRRATLDTGQPNSLIIDYNGVDTYTQVWNTAYRTTVYDFVQTQNAGGAGTMLGDHGIRCGVDTDGGTNPLNAELRFSVDNGGSGNLALITIVGGITASAGITAATGGRIQIPYVATAINGQFISHSFRLNFETDAAGGAAPEPHSLLFKRWGNGTTIGAPATFFQTSNASDPNSSIIVLLSYTSSPSDAFVDQGFFFEISADNDAVDLENKVGLLIQTQFQEPSHF